MTNSLEKEVTLVAMQLTSEQQAMLDGAQGEVMAKVMRSLVMYGETFGPRRWCP